MTNFIKAGDPFYPTDHCGVLRSTKHKAKLLQFALFQAGKTQNFSRANRASIDRVSNLKLKLPPLEAQEKIVSAIEACEKEILRLENEKESLHGKTDAILKQYLF